MLTNVGSCAVEQFRRLWQQEMIALNQHIARFYLFKIALTPGPGSYILRILREEGMHGTHQALRPGKVCLCFHSLQLHDLYEAVETQHSVLRQPLHQGKGQQGFEHLVKAEEIRHRLTQRQRPMGSTLCEQFFRDVVWGEKGAEL